MANGMSTALAVIPTPQTDESNVYELVKMFEEADDATRQAREKAERDRDYYDGKQWTSAEESALKKRGQPVVTFNRIQRKVNFLKGLESQTRKDPKCFPREPGDDGSANAATDALRYVVDANDWDHIRSEAFESILVEGTTAIMVGAKNGREGIDPEIVFIPWDRYFYDPHARKIDLSDKSYDGIVTWMDLEDAKVRWPDRIDILTDTWQRASQSSTYDDRPKFQLWADYKRKRVRVVEMYYKLAGEWTKCVFTQSGHLEDPIPSPFICEEKKPSNPIQAMSAFVDRDNNRYGEVRALISPQDEVNKRRSKGLHLINSRQMRISRAAQISASDAKRELAKPDGVLIADDGEVQVLETGDMAAANFQMLQEAKAEIDLLGPNAALQGKNENDMSGRAILAQQQGGMTEVALLMDRLRQLSLNVYRACWERVQQYWKGPRWIRITDDPGDPQFVGINQPKTMLDVAKERLGNDPQAAQKLQLIAGHPMAHQVMQIDNNVGELDVDITIDEGMDTPTVQAEQFDTLMKMLPSLVGLPPPVMKLIITMSSLRDKDQLLELVDQISQVDPIQLQKQQKAEALAEAGAVSNIQKTNSETQKNQATAEATADNANAELINAHTGAMHRIVEAGVNIHQAMNPPEPAQAA